MLIGAVATCYVSTFRAMAEYSKLSFHGLDVRVEGILEKQEGGFRFTQIVLRPSVSIEKPEDRERTQRLIEKAERACLISRSLNSKIATEASIRVEEAVGAAK
jgi:peroxiredoxin-like protein